jgi:hypothetical protein
LNYADALRSSQETGQVVSIRDAGHTGFDISWNAERGRWVVIDPERPAIYLAPSIVLLSGDDTSPLGIEVYRLALACDFKDPGYYILDSEDYRRIAPHLGPEVKCLFDSRPVRNDLPL